MSLINPMATASAITNTTAQVLNRDSRNQNLRPDQVITATVEEGGLERVLLNLQGKKQWVETDIPLATGQKISLQPVDDSGGRQLLLQPGLLDDYLRRVIHLVGRALPFHEFATVLPDFADHLPEHTLLNQLLAPLAAREPPDAHWLAQLSTLLGLNFEKKLAHQTGRLQDNLKGVLLRHAGHTPDRHSHAAELLQVLEAHQLFQAKLALSGLYYLPLPLADSGWGYILFDLPQRGERQDDKEPRTTTIRVCLSLSALGPVTAIINCAPAGVSLRLEVLNPDALSHLQQQRHAIEQALAPWRVQAVHLFAGTEPPERQLLQLLTAQSKGVVNARI